LWVKIDPPPVALNSRGVVYDRRRVMTTVLFGPAELIPVPLLMLDERVKNTNIVPPPVAGVTAEKPVKELAAATLSRICQPRSRAGRRPNHDGVARSASAAIGDLGIGDKELACAKSAGPGFQIHWRRQPPGIRGLYISRPLI
jgi:hypothetical protein